MTLFAGHALACRRGERLVFRGLGGPNGSGKSSLLRLMSGLLPPYSGTLSWAGEPTARDQAAHHARLHFIGHQDALKPVLTSLETVAFWGALRGGDARSAMAALESFALDH